MSANKETTVVTKNDWECLNFGGIMRRVPLLVWVIIVAVLAGTVSASAQSAALNAQIQRFTAQFAAGNLTAALVEAKKMDAMAKAEFGSTHVNYGMVLLNLALTQKLLKNYNDAAQTYQRALAAIEKDVGLEHQYGAKAINDLAVVYQAQGKFGEAANLYKRALRIREKVFGAKHADVAQTLKNLTDLAMSYDRQGKYGEAIDLFQTVLPVRERALGANHLDVAFTLNDLANAYQGRGNYAEADKLLLRALSTIEKVAGPNHAKVAVVLNGLALGHSAQDRLGEAEKAYLRAAEVAEKTIGAESALMASILYNLAGTYSAQGKYIQAEKIYQRTLAVSEKVLGANHPKVGNSLVGLAIVYQQQGKLGEAVGLLQRAVAIAEKALGANHPDTVNAGNNLAAAYQKQGKYSEAEAIYQRSLASTEQVLGSEHPAAAIAINNLAAVYEEQGKYGEAISLYNRALSISEKVSGANHSNVARTLINLANVYKSQGKYTEAERFNLRALAINEKTFGASHPTVASNLNNLANIYEAQGKTGEAERYYQGALAINEKALGLSHPVVAGELYNLANIYRVQGRYSDASNLFLRALAIQDKASGPDHPDVATALNGLAVVYHDQGKHAEALPLYQRALAIWEKTFGVNHPSVAGVLNNLANLHELSGKIEEASGFHRRALAIREKALGAGHPEVAMTLNNLAGMYSTQGRLRDAELLHQRAFAIADKAFGPNHPNVAMSLNNLALTSARLGKPDEALAFARKASAAVIAHSATEIPGAQQAASAGNHLVRNAEFFHNHVAALTAVMNRAGDAVTALGAEALDVAQWAGQSSAAAALQQVGVRLASGNGALATLVRENQDLAAAWREKDKALAAALSRPENKQDRTGVEALRQQIGDIETRVAAIVVRLEKESPDYAALASPKPLPVKEVQKLLGVDEALVFFLTGDRRSYVFAVTRDALELRAIPLGTKELADKVSTFRRGLDVDELNRVIEVGGKAELFDLGKANELYVSLLGPVEVMVKSKRHLLVVPSGALTALPFHLLVTEKSAVSVPSAAQRIGSENFVPYRDAAWLLKRHAVTVLPSVDSLKTLRVLARKERGSKPMIGFGDPVFADEAPPKPQAVGGNSQRAAGAAKPTKVAATTRAFADYWTGAGVDRAMLAQSLPRLEDTADELKAVAKNLGAPSSDILLRSAATEAAVKQAKLSDYRVVYFATHGLVAGDVEGLAEPSLALTLPKQASELDDGLLTASEVAQLKLNADWVVLSACNTIAGGAPGAEALSGLARSFFYAGARALLVSHWAVESDAATKLTTSTFSLLKADPKLGRAEAMRRAMLAYMADTSNPRNAYPAFWGPFAVIGEGAVQ